MEKKKYINQLEQPFAFYSNGKGQQFATLEAVEILQKKLNEVIEALNERVE